jgi:hypothetical protein
MTQYLRYLGPTTDQFRTGHVYRVLLAIDRERILLCEPWGITYPYQSLAHLLQFWQPALNYVPVQEDKPGDLPSFRSLT